LTNDKAGSAGVQKYVKNNTKLNFPEYFKTQVSLITENVSQSNLNLK